MRRKIAHILGMVLIASMLFGTDVFAAEEEKNGNTELIESEGTDENEEEESEPVVVASFLIDGEEIEITDEYMSISIDDETGKIQGINLSFEGLAEVTEKNLERIVPQIFENIENKYPDAKGFYFQIFWETSNEKRDNTIAIPISAETAACINRLEDQGMTVTVSVATENGGKADYKNIKGETTLGFDEHDYISDTHWDFYGSGFTFSIMEYPYDGGSKPEFWLKTGENQMQKLDAEKITYNEEYQDVTVKADITYPGLHLLLPVQSDDNVSIEVNEESDLTAVIVPYIDSTAKKIVVKLPKIENSDNQYNLDKAIFSKLAEEEGKELEIEHDGIIYEFEKITNKDIGFTVGAEEKTTEVKQQLDAVVYAIDFKHAGELPGEALVTINVDLTDGAYTWSYFDGSKLTESVDVEVSDGKVTVPLAHCSIYVLTEGSTGNSGNNATTGGNTNTSNSGGSSSGSSNKDSAEADESQNTSVEIYEAPSSAVSQQLVNVPQTADTFPMELLLMAAAICMLVVGVVYEKSKKEI